jgi:hypothetical protein
VLNDYLSIPGGGWVGIKNSKLRIQNCYGGGRAFRIPNFCLLMLPCSTAQTRPEIADIIVMTRRRRQIG